MDKTLYENKWLALREKDGYTYLHENRCNGKLVAILVFTKNENGIDKILGRFEDNPAHGGIHRLCSITGGVENDDVITTVLMELEEEGGFKVNEEDLIPLGEARPYKAADTVCSLFGFDATGKEETRNENPPGDDSGGEESCYCEWVSLLDIIDCGDSLAHSMIVRLSEVI